jgi:hypothetical protein
VQSRLLLDVVVAQSTSVLELLASKNKSLLVWGNTLLVLDLGFDIVNGIGRLDFQGDGLSSQAGDVSIILGRGLQNGDLRLDEDLHTTT